MNAAHLDGGDYLDRKQAAAYCGIDPSTLSTYVSRGEPKGNPFPKPIEVGEARLYPVADLDEWKARRPGRGNWGPRETD